MKKHRMVHSELLHHFTQRREQVLLSQDKDMIKFFYLYLTASEGYTSISVYKYLMGMNM